MQKTPKINIIGSVAVDLKESIDDFVCIVERLQNDIDKLKKEIKVLKRKNSLNKRV